MKIIFYSFPRCEESSKIKDFLKSRNLDFKEITSDNEEIKKEILKLSLQNKKPIVKIIKNRGIYVCTGFNEMALKRML